MGRPGKDATEAIVNFRKLLASLSAAEEDNNGGTHSSQEPGLAADTVRLLSRTLKRQWKCYRQQLRQTKSDFSEKAVHDLRIEARRLLSLLDLLQPFIPARPVRKARRKLKCQL